MLIKKINNRAQSMLEYVTLIAVAVSVLIAMSAYIKRGAQGMIRTVADQVGDEQNAEQKFDDTGHLINAITVTRSTTDKETVERVGIVNYIFSDITQTLSTSTVNAGFQERLNN